MNNRKEIERHQVRTAILVDGGFYRKRSKKLWGNKTPSTFAIFNHHLYKIYHFNIISQCAKCTK